MKGQCMQATVVPGSWWPSVTPRPSVLLRTEPYKQVDMKTFQAMPVGSVVLVRSEAVPFLGDHFFVVTGPLVKKPHGLRPQGISVAAKATDSAVLDKHTPVNGATILRLTNPSDLTVFFATHSLGSILL